MINIENLNYLILDTYIVKKKKQNKMSNSPPPIDEPKANGNSNNDNDDLFFSSIGESNINLNDNDVINKKKTILLQQYLLKMMSFFRIQIKSMILMNYLIRKEKK